MNLETIITAAGVDGRDRIADAIEAAYALGFHEGRILEREISKSQAFAAIRRAAAEARMCDKHKQYTAALAVRDAIRAAIGSPKA